MVGYSKGRTERVLRERCDTLINDPSTRTIGLDLKRYHECVETAMKWRGGAHVHSLMQETLLENLKMFNDNNTILPAEICQELVARRMKKHTEAKDWAQVMIVVLPFKKPSDVWDIFDPKLRTLPRVEAWRLRASKGTCFDNLINPLLFDGEEKQAIIEGICRAALAALDSVDPIEMESKYSAAMLSEMIEVFEGILALLEMPFSSAHIQSIIDVTGEEGCKAPLAKGPMQSIRTAINAAPWMKARAKKVLDARAIIVEKEATLTEHVGLLQEWAHTYLQNLDRSKLNDMSAELVTMLDTFAVIQQHLGSAPIINFGKDLWVMTDRFVSFQLLVATDPEAKEKTEEWWGQLHKLIAGASISFPLEQQPSVWQAAVADIKNQAGTKHIFNEMREQLKGWSGCAEVDGERVKVLKSSVEKAANTNVRATEGDMESLCKIMGDITEIVADSQFQECDDYQSLAGQMCRFFKGDHAMNIANAWITSACSLTASNTFLEKGPESEDELEKVKRNVAALTTAVKESKDSVKVVKSIGETATDKLRSAMQARLDKFDKSLAKELDTRADLAHAKMVAKYDDLRSVAFGGKVIGQAWSNGLSNKGLTTEQLVTFATESGLTDCDHKQIEALSTELDTAIKDWESAFGKAGKVIADEEKEKFVKMKARGHLTSIERELVDIAKDGTKSTEDRAKAISDVVKKCRKGFDIDERKALPAGFFKWMFHELTSARRT